MWTLLILSFSICYLLITLEHKLYINKSAIALFAAILVWSIVLHFSIDVVTLFNQDAFNIYLEQNPNIQSYSLRQQTIHFLVNYVMLNYLGSTSETLFFLIGAMTVVEIMDQHGGFNFITHRITTRKVRSMLWTVSIITFFLSALLDNLTTSIVMVMLIRKLVANQKIRWWICGAIIISANAGGAWSPIGDVTTIMLWVKGNITSLQTVKNLFLPSLVSMIIPIIYIQKHLHGEIKEIVPPDTENKFYNQLSLNQRSLILILGIIGLLAVPVFKTITGMPPFMSVLAVLAVLWIFTEIFYKHKHDIEEVKKNRVTRVMTHLDMPTILFFLGILMAVGGLQVSGILGYTAQQLDSELHNIYIIDGIIGICSSIVDNVPLVASAIGMYTIPTVEQIATSIEPSYLSQFIQDGSFWQLLAYCAGVGGSILIIGSAAGVVVMGLEKISFSWYLKRFSLIILLGYLAGMVVFWGQTFIF